MKNIGIVVALVAMLMLTACSDTPRTTYANFQEAYIAAVNPVVDLRQSHLIDDRTYNFEIMPLIRTGNLGLNDYDAATKAGADGTQFRTVVQTVTRGLIAYYVAHQSR